MRPVRGQRADRPGPGPVGKASPLAPVVRLGVVGDRMVEYGGEVPTSSPVSPSARAEDVTSPDILPAVPAAPFALAVRLSSIRFPC